MNEATRIKRLKVFLRVYGILSLPLFGFLSFNFLIQNPAFNPGGSLHWLIWDDVTGHVGPMVFIIYLVMGVFFFLAANDPLKYKSFLDFTAWANLAHGLLMLPMLFHQPPLYYSKVLTDIPFVLILAVGIFWLRPRSEEYAGNVRSQSEVGRQPS